MVLAIPASPYNEKLVMYKLSHAGGDYRDPIGFQQVPRRSRHF